ncbi:MAG: DUF2442 domain-containing protein [Terrimicrobiaceae bacterium]
MKTKFKDLRVIPYGMAKGRLESFNLQGLRISRTWRRPERQEKQKAWDLLVTFSRLMDDAFVQAFQEKATSETRLIVLNDSPGSDRLFSRLVELQIRSPHRFYVAEAKWGTVHTNWDVLLQSLLGRLVAAVESKESHQRIFDARLEDGILRVISPEFSRLEIPISRIPALAKVHKESAESFEIDEDGSFIYWPDLDLHLGWEQFQQIVDPMAVQKAKRKDREFNMRYGAAIRKVREAKGLSVSELPGLSKKQLGRIESGVCRLTSNAADKLAAAHGMTPNEYLESVAAALT